MTTHNLIIYHCLACGAVMHCEPERDIPQCCGRPMIKAAAETVGNSNGGREVARPPVQPPAERAERKPR